MNSACDIGCDEYGYPVRRGPVVTEQMLDAAIEVWKNDPDGPVVVFFEDIYRAMHLNRPLSDGPV
jgi:hypothetical protein